MTDPNNSPEDLSAKLAAAFDVLATDLTFTSESDRPYSGFSAEMSRETELTGESFRIAVGIGEEFETFIEPAAPYFEHMKDPDQGYPSGYVEGYTLLEKVMKATLSGLWMAHVREEDAVEVPVYLFGRLESGSLVGLSSIAIET